jgi:hypothetical protein
MGMSTLERDKQILDLIVKTYYFQFEFRERLDSKLNNFIAITGTISTLSIGVALFVLERVSTRNPYYIPLIFTFFAYLGLFVSATIIGLKGYKPTEFTWYPEDPERLIREYSKFSSETEVIRVVAASFASATNANKDMNNRKSRICNYVFWLLIFGVLAVVLFAIFMVLALSIPIDP